MKLVYNYATTLTTLPAMLLKNYCNGRPNHLLMLAVEGIAIIQLHHLFIYMCILYSVQAQRMFVAMRWVSLRFQCIYLNACRTDKI